MKVLSRTQTILVIVGSFLVSGALAQDVTVADIGGAAVKIPAPDGFFRYDGKRAKADVFAKTIAGSGRLLAAYSSREDLAAVLNGQLPKLERNFAATLPP
jgi:hypothetical protein